MMKIQVLAVALCLIGLAFGEGSSQREAKSLLNVFPFNNGAHAGGHHGDHHGDHGAHGDHAAHGNGRSAAASTSDGSRASRQNLNDDIPLDIGSIAAAGERCIDKVVTVEETEYDDHIECHHSYTKRCHTTYTTDFEAQQEEKCEENFKKNCFIEYKKTAHEEETQFCNTPFICEGEGPEECKTVYETECATRYHEHAVKDDIVNCETIQEEKCEDVTQGYTTEQKCTKWPKQVCQTRSENVKKYSPETECKKVPRQLCGPSGCVPRPGKEECFPKKETIVVEEPVETCNLEPQKSCKQVTKLVPSLKPAEECVDVPKEVCSRSRKNPRKILKPVVKKWCYVPSAASGLAQ